jgi:HEPN domain-containing protein
LLLLAREQGLDVEDLLKDRGVLEELSDQYLAPRYPNFRGRTARELEDYDKGFAESCLSMVVRIWSRVEDAVRQWVSDQPS